MDNLSGHTIKGYELHEQIGVGGFGAVYRAHQPIVGREVAIKVILPQYANQPDFIRRFEVEAQLVARLEHMNIVPLYDYWREPDGAYLVCAAAVCAIVSGTGRSRWPKWGGWWSRLGLIRFSGGKTARTGSQHARPSGA
jgi:hypothetical protein